MTEAVPSPEDPPTPQDTSPGAVEALAVARAAAKAADDKQGTDTRVLYVGGVLAIADYFVITSAGNRRQVRAVAEEVEEQLRRDLSRRPLRTEGLNQHEWVLLDYGDVVVHVFADETRRFYEIERLYRDAPRIEWQSGVADSSRGSGLR